ncbi:ShlB/FhaC/HecB family hemolysin secretion/activation protein [Xenorhabdus thailandensis]|uniref:ShlB/FhaC/HecB family hemolysin secretion/activation protein n=1 Tax=Xenorhabdus thailandensis TaxID=3136255 RepID=UPI0030F477F0
MNILQKVTLQSSMFHPSYFKPITNNIYYLTSAYAQTNPNSLYSHEKVSIGGLYSVRGFKDKFITGNLGGYWRNEINWKLVNIPKFGELSFNGSLDTGWIKRN